MRIFEDMWVGERAAEHASIDSGRASGEDMKEREIELAREGREGAFKFICHM